MSIFRSKPIVGFVFSATAACMAMPVAFADSKKSIYDDDESIAVAPTPGLTSPSKEKESDKPSELETFEKELSLKRGDIDGIKIYTSDYLEKTVEASRKFLAKNFDKADNKLQTTFNKYLEVEDSVSSTVVGLKSPHEDMLPGTIYILVGTLTGSILARRRNFLLRFASPVIFGLASFAYFLPETFNNTRAFAWKYEKQVPAVADAHIKTLEVVEEAKKATQNAAEISEASLVSAVHTIRNTVADLTGLQLPEEPKKKK